MKRLHLKWNLAAAAAIVGLLAVATPSFAWYCNGPGTGMGYGGGYGMRGYGPGSGMMGYGYGPRAAANPNLTAAQKKQIHEVQEKYQTKLNDLRQKIHAKYSELATAQAKDSTTVGQLKTLQGSLFQLQSQYRALLDQVNTEISRIPGAGPYVPGGYMGSMMYGGYPGGMGGYYPPCAW